MKTEHQNIFKYGMEIKTFLTNLYHNIPFPKKQTNMKLNLTQNRNSQSVTLTLRSVGVQGRWHCLISTGAQFEGDLGKILVLAAEILPYIGLREKWESP